MIQLIIDFITNTYNAFNIEIPGFGISISNIILACLFLTCIIKIFLDFNKDRG